jgi:hypothetical protein
MPVEGREKGIRSPYTVRFGITNPSYTGVNTQKTAVSLLDTEGPKGINLRIVGGKPVNRGGQEKLNSATVEPIHGFYDTTSEAGLNGVGQGATEPVPGGGRYLYFTGVHVNGNNRVLFRFDTVTHLLEEAVIGATYPTKFYAVRGLLEGTDGLLYEAGALFDDAANPIPRVIQATWGSPVVVGIQFSIASGGAQESGFGVDGPDGTYPWWVLANSVLEDPNAALKFYAARPYRPGTFAAWDGKVYRDGVLDDTPTFVLGTTADVGAYFAAFNGTIYTAWGREGLASGQTSNTIRKRIAATNWTNLTLPAAPFGGFAAIGNPVVYASKLWVGGYYHVNGAGGDRNSGYLSITTGDVVTLARQIASPANNAPINQVVFNDRLYYLYAVSNFLSNPNENTWLGMYNGTTWTDAHWDCKIDGVVHQLAGIRHTGDSLWAVALVGGTTYWLIKSRGADTTQWRRVFNLSNVSTSTPLVDLVDLDT